MESLSVEIHFSEDSLIYLNLIIGFILFGVALDLRLQEFRTLFTHPRPIITGLCSQFLLLPAGTFLLIKLLNIPLPYALGMLLVASCPGGNISNYISYLARANTALSISLTALSTVFAVFLTPLNFLLWSHLLTFGTDVHLIQINVFNLAEIVFLIIALPVTAGLVCHHFFPAFTQKIKRTVKLISLFLFTGFVAVVLLANIEAFSTSFNEIFLYVFLHNAMGYAIGFGVASLFLSGLAEKKTISIETGIQNSALALVLIFTFFEGNINMAVIAAWWGVWHGISGSLFALFYLRLKS